MLKTSEISKIKKSIKGGDEITSYLFSVLGDKNRYRIMKLLIKEKELCVSELAKVLDISISAVSQHLRILEMSGLVTCERDGQMMCYRPRIEDPKIKKIISLM